MTRESILKKIEEVLFKHRANDRGNRNLHLFDDRDKLQEQDRHYADLILSLFIELVEELVDLLNIEEQNIIYSKPTSDLPKGRARDEFEARMKLRSELRQKLAELGGK